MQNLSDGQRLALKQIEEISASSNGGLTFSSPTTCTFPRWITVRVTYSCAHLPKGLNGRLPLNDREAFSVFIPPDFPFNHPTIRSVHKRFAGYPHVQWGNYLCLYQAPSTEWTANDGMYGFFDRLAWWLHQGAKGELDPIGAPLHPPVAYSGARTKPGVIPKVNAPEVHEKPWVGFADLDNTYSHFVELVGWRKSLPEGSQPKVAPAFLLNEKMPIEFPEKLSELISALKDRGVSETDLMVFLQLALHQNGDEAPLIIIVGTPMRGISGEPKPLQHLTAWKIDSQSIGMKALKLSLNIYLDQKEFKEIGVSALEIFKDWLSSSDVKVEWLRVREARPEVTLPRDELSSMRWLDGKTVSLWGCGALGSTIAEMLVRGGVKKIILRDEGQVAPGLLVRQQFDYEDICEDKPNALMKRLLRIKPDLEVKISSCDILSDPLDEKDWTEQADLIIESTGSNALLQKLEMVRQKNTEHRTNIISLAIGHRADFGLACVAPKNFSGGAKDIERKVKIHTASKPSFEKFASEFWPDPQRTDVFQPEPGCSETTFIGSSTDVISLASRLLKLSITFLQSNPNQGKAFLLHQPSNVGSTTEIEVNIYNDFIIKDYNRRYEVRLSPSAWKEILAWRKKSRRKTPTPETGGLLFGEYDEACGVFWVSEASGPPPDSIATSNRFQCGTKGIKELHEYHSKQSRNSVQCVGLWHTHPNSSPLPSDIDIEGMKRILTQSGSSPRNSLLLIIGDLPTSPSVFSAVFSRGDQALIGEPTNEDCQELTFSKETEVAGTIGLALSGGGSRAIAFHLGCLRALHHRNLLGSIKVISTISGGSVLGAAYAYSNGSFEEFEDNVRAVLKKGLTKTFIRKLFFHPLLLKVMLTLLISGSLSLIAFLLRTVLSIFTIPFGRSAITVNKFISKIRPPLVRWFNRSNAMEATLSSVFFGEKKLHDQRRNNVTIVINATETRSGTAFRFGSTESGSSRFGLIDPNYSIRVSEAVAASACFPVMLPAIDRIFPFWKNGLKQNKRVLLTDGGVYDNLGVTALEPGRSTIFSTNAHQVDYLICCSAGAGIHSGGNIPYWWPSRMIASFETTFKRVQEGSMKILHNYVASKQLKGFIFSYLGQIDQRLPAPPPDLVLREPINEYPTDFSAMHEDDIETISLRGEQLTRLLLSRYCPEL